jgi:hypothetical protein
MLRQGYDRFDEIEEQVIPIHVPRGATVLSLLSTPAGIQLQGA